MVPQLPLQKGVGQRVDPYDQTQPVVPVFTSPDFSQRGWRKAGSCGINIFSRTCCTRRTTASAMTECNQSRFEFAGHFSRQVVARFDGGAITTDSGGLLLRETDRRLNLLPRLAECFLDARDPVFVQHSVQELVSQRVYGLALGYEDLNDHEQLRQDPLMRVLAGKADVEDSTLAGKSTLNRLELGDGTPHRYKKITFWKDGFDELLVRSFWNPTPPRRRKSSWMWMPPISVAWKARRTVLPRLL